MVIVPKKERRFLHANLIKGDMKRIRETLIKDGISIASYTVSRFFCTDLHYQEFGIHIANAARSIIEQRQKGAKERMASLEALTSAA